MADPDVMADPVIRVIVRDRAIKNTFRTPRQQLLNFRREAIT